MLLASLIIAVRFVVGVPRQWLVIVRGFVWMVYFAAATALESTLLEPLDNKHSHLSYYCESCIYYIYIYIYYIYTYYIYAYTVNCMTRIRILLIMSIRLSEILMSREPKALR